ncbi:MAG: PAS domain S-box protein [Anaerolineae bacterium]|nr:PAS domain S-box protein [Anaerolineae bacterium]MDW8173982.1 PAS domain S-box protein [Anaerolineae bacterium]
MARHIFRKKYRRLRTSQFKTSIRAIADIVLDSPFGVLIVNLRGIVLFANPAAHAIFQQGELEGRAFGIPITRIDSVEIQALRQKDGWRALEMRVSEIDWQGQQAYLVHLSDLAASRRAELEREERASLLNSVIQTSLEGIFVTIPQTGQIVSANPAACAILGMDEATIVQLRREDIIDTSDERWQTILEARRHSGFAQGEARMRRGDGTLVEVELSTTIFRDHRDNERGTVIFRDISQRKAAEQALHERERAFRALVENNPDVIVRLDEDLRYIYANPALLRESGVPLEAVLGRTLYDIIGQHHPLEDIARQVLETGQEQRAEFDYFGPVDHRYYEARLAPELDEAGKVRSVLMISRDITPLRRAQESLRLFARAVDASSTGVTIADMTLPDQPLIYVNPTFCDISGYDPGEVIGRNCRLLQANDRDQEAVCVMREAIRAGREVRVRLRNYRKDGTLFWNELRLSPIFDLGGQLTHYVGIQMDVTAQVEAEQELTRLYQQVNNYTQVLEERVEERTAALRHAKDQVEAILNSISDLVILLNPRGLIEQVNPSFCRWFSVDSDQIFYRPLVEVINAKQPHLLMDVLLYALETSEPQRIEVHGHTPDGKSYTFDGALASVGAGDDLRVVCSLRDISTQKQLEEHLRASLARERELSEMKSRFTSMISHEFRTPLAVIMSSAALLREYHERLTSEKRLNHLDKIETHSRLLAEMMNDALFITRSEATGIQVHRSTQHLPTLLQHIIDDARTLNPHGNWVNYQHEGSEQASVDPTLLRQILQNLLSNAVKYSPDKTPIELHSRLEGQWLTLTVRDYGIGIPPEAMPHLFEAFYRAPNVNNISGTGLGLVIVKRAVDALGGDVYAESQLGSGTTFTVRLPCP